MTKATKRFTDEIRSAEIQGKREKLYTESRVWWGDRALAGVAWGAATSPPKTPN